MVWMVIRTNVRKIARQREVLMNVATMLADVRFEWSREPQQRARREALRRAKASAPP